MEETKDAMGVVRRDGSVMRDAMLDGCSVVPILSSCTNLSVPMKGLLVVVVVVR